MKRRKTQSEQRKMPRNKLGKVNSQEFRKLPRTWHPKRAPLAVLPIACGFFKEKLWFFKENLYFLKEIWEQTTKPGYPRGAKTLRERERIRAMAREEYP